MDQGHIPSFCTACYREGRTGDRFMSLCQEPPDPQLLSSQCPADPQGISAGLRLARHPGRGPGHDPEGTGQDPQRQGARPHHPVPGRHRGRAAGLPLLGQQPFPGLLLSAGSGPVLSPWRLPPFSFLHPAGQGPSCPASLSRRSRHAGIRTVFPRDGQPRGRLFFRGPRVRPLPFPGRSARAAFRPALAGVAGPGAPVSPAAQGAACACARPAGIFQCLPPQLPLLRPAPREQASVPLQPVGGGAAAGRVTGRGRRGGHAGAAIGRDGPQSPLAGAGWCAASRSASACP